VSPRPGALLADSGVAWTSLRNGFYAHSLDWLLGPWRETGVIATPPDGPVSWTERADEVEAAAVILADERHFDGPVTLTATAAVTFDEIAGIASELTGRDIRRVVTDDDKWVAEQVAQGTPEPMARFQLGFFQAAREGRFAGVDPLLGSLLRHPPRTVRDLLAERTTAWGHRRHAQTRRAMPARQQGAVRTGNSRTRPSEGRNGAAGSADRGRGQQPSPGQHPDPCPRAAVLEAEPVAHGHRGGPQASRGRPS
jgi:hypothetical protein